MDEGNKAEITGMPGRRGCLIQSTILQYLSPSTSTIDQDMVSERLTREEAFENHLLQDSNKKAKFRYSNYRSSLPAINIRGAENLYFTPKNPKPSSARPRTIFGPIVINDTDSRENIVLSNNTKNSKDEGAVVFNNQVETNTNKATESNTVSQIGKEGIIIATENDNVKQNNQEKKTTTSSGKRRFINNAAFSSSSVSESCSHRKSKPISQFHQKFPRQPFEIFCASQVTPYLMRNNSVKNLRRVLDNLGYYQHLTEELCTFDSFLKEIGEGQVQDYLNQVNSNRVLYNCSDCDFKSDMYVVLLQHRDKFEHYTQ